MVDRNPLAKEIIPLSTHDQMFASPQKIQKTVLAKSYSFDRFCCFLFSHYDKNPFVGQFDLICYGTGKNNVTI